MNRRMFYKDTHSFAGRKSGGGEAKLTLYRFIEICGDCTLLEIILVD